MKIKNGDRADPKWKPLPGLITSFPILNYGPLNLFGRVSLNIFTTLFQSTTFSSFFSIPLESAAFTILQDSSAPFFAYLDNISIFFVSASNILIFNSINDRAKSSIFKVTLSTTFYSLLTTHSKEVMSIILSSFSSIGYSTPYAPNVSLRSSLKNGNLAHSNFH